MMKQLLPLLAAAAMAVAAPALAGNPQSTGLTLTQEVDRRARSTVKVAHADRACLETAARSAGGLAGVQKVSVREGALHATFDSPAKATDARHEVNAAVAAACQTGRTVAATE